MYIFLDYLGFKTYFVNISILLDERSRWYENIAFIDRGREGGGGKTRLPKPVKNTNRLFNVNNITKILNKIHNPNWSDILGNIHA